MGTKLGASLLCPKLIAEDAARWPVKYRMEHRSEKSITHKLWLIMQSNLGYSFHKKFKQPTKRLHPKV